MRASKVAVKVGVVVHGPEVIDSGWAEKALKVLSGLGPVTAVLGGTMGRVAVIDAALEDKIDISRRETPSRSVERLEPSVDVMILLNCAKTAETGLAFGAMVRDKAKPKKPLYLADYGGGFVSVLAGDEKRIGEKIARILGLKLVAEGELQSRTESSGRTVRRRIFGAVPGENVSVNGIVVARALEEAVTIVTVDGRITEVLGAEVKSHGLEKLSFVDLGSAILRTGDIRRTMGVQRTIQTPGCDAVLIDHAAALPATRPRISQLSGRDAVLIDHAAEDTFEDARGAMVVVTVGDDTTAIAGEILARLGTPLVGIVDGDLDRLCSRTATPEGSVVIEVNPGCDDVVGRRVREKIFGGEDRTSMNGLSFEDLINKIRAIAEGDFKSMRRF